MVVLCRVFWLQSMKTLPGRSALAISLVTRRGCCRSSSWATARAKSPRLLVGAGRVQRHVELQALGARRLGPRPQVDGGEDVADLERDLAALGDGGRLAGVEVEDHQRGRVGIDGPGHGSVQLERRQVGRPDDGGHRVEHAVADGAAVVSGAGRGADPVGPVLGAALLEEALAVDPVREAAQGEASVAEVGQQRRARSARSSR